MFPINYNDPYTKNDGSVVPVGDIIGGGGGGTVTPDYENEILNVGTVGDWHYYIPMSKEYVGDGIEGYEIKTNPASSSSLAMIDIYTIIYVNGEIFHKELIKTLLHSGDKNYEDDNIAVTYSTGNNWSVTSKVSLYNESGTVYESPLLWSYSTNVDYIMLLENPTA